MNEKTNNASSLSRLERDDKESIFENINGKILNQFRKRFKDMD